MKIDTERIHPRLDKKLFTSNKYRLVVWISKAPSTSGVFVLMDGRKRLTDGASLIRPRSTLLD